MEFPLLTSVTEKFRLPMGRLSQSTNRQSALSRLSHEQCKFHASVALGNGSKLGGRSSDYSTKSDKCREEE